jgi:DNA-binding NtrC family response regulator
MSNAILIIEDEATLAKNIQRYLERAEYEVQVVSSGEQGLERFDGFQPDVVLLDYRLSGMDGLEVLRGIRERDAQVKVIFMTAHGNVETAVEAMKAGADEYLTKPVALAELRLLVDKAFGQDRIEGELSYYHARDARRGGLAAIQGVSPAIVDLKQRIERMLDTESSLKGGVPPAVLVTGETGTGKELVARAIHFGGARRERAFVEVNCASLPSQLVEAELFGHERGAFTDAKGRKLGLVEAANGGTLFLDEIGEIGHDVQVKLLKLLEDRRVRRLGSVRDREVDVRVVAATNREMEAHVQSGNFRSDLYFRLRIVELKVPPLRERGDDVLLLAEHFLDHHARRYGKSGLAFSAPARSAMMAYSWPGNVRELRNVVENAVLLSAENRIGPEHLSLSPMLAAANGNGTHGAGRFPPALPAEGIRLEDVERDLVVQALDRESWNVTRAARLLGLSRDTLRYRIEKFQLKEHA